MDIYFLKTSIVDFFPGRWTGEKVELNRLEVGFGSQNMVVHGQMIFADGHLLNVGVPNIFHRSFRAAIQFLHETSVLYGWMTKSVFCKTIPNSYMLCALELFL